MKTTFTLREILNNKGCYSEEEVRDLFPKKVKTIDINYVLKCKIPINDKRWFLFNNCDLTTNERKELSLKLINCVLPIYEKKNPKDLDLKECLEAAENVNKGIISKISLQKKLRTVIYYDEVLNERDYVMISPECAVGYAILHFGEATLYYPGKGRKISTLANLSYNLSSTYAAQAARKPMYAKKINKILIDFTSNK